MDEKKPSENPKTGIIYTKLERFFKFSGTFIAGIIALFGYQKMPSINESTKISEAVRVVKNLNPEEMSALQGVQIASLEKQVKHNLEAQLAAVADLKAEMRIFFREYDERTTKRLDKHGDLILNNIKSIARLEAMVPRSRAVTQ